MVDWSKTAFLFPGQGAQVVGMGKDLADAYPLARETFQQADALLDFAFSDLYFNGPEDVLTETINTQPALYIYGVAVLRALQSELPAAVPAFVVGHSLGEFTALTAAGALSFEDGVRLVRERGRLMKEAGDKTPGAMAALLGLDSDTVRDICERAKAQTGGTLVLANDNCPGQVVISGDEATLEAGLALAQQAGVKRAVKLAISIASHSPLMEPANAQFRKALAATAFQTPRIPVYSPATAGVLTDVATIRRVLDDQLISPVRWTDTVQAVIAAGAETFVELGPKDVLCGLMKRIDRSKSCITLDNVASVRQFVEANR